MPEPNIAMVRTWKDVDSMERTVYLQTDSSGQNLYIDTNVIHYLVSGADATDETAVFDYVIAHAPATSRSWAINHVRVEERRGFTEWVVTVSYGRRDDYPGSQSSSGESHDDTFSFNTGGGTTLLRTARSAGAHGGINDPFLLLNPDADGNPQGQEIVSRALNFTISKWMRPSQVTNAFMRQIAQYTGTINNATWRGWAAGEVLFLGANSSRGGDDSDDWWQIGMEFSAAPTTQEVPIWLVTAAGEEPTEPTFITLHGWQYLNVRTQNHYSTSSSPGGASYTTRKPVVTGYSVCNLYPEANWSNLPV